MNVRGFVRLWKLEKRSIRLSKVPVTLWCRTIDCLDGGEELMLSTVAPSLSPDAQPDVNRQKLSRGHVLHVIWRGFIAHL
jgi:hypothetical protein